MGGGWKIIEFKTNGCYFSLDILCSKNVQAYSMCSYNCEDFLFKLALILLGRGGLKRCFFGIHNDLVVV